MKKRFFLFIICFVQLNLFAQTPFLPAFNGEILNQAPLKKLIKERGYDAVSAFDTISYKPLLIYALFVKKNKLGIMDIKGREICPALYDDIVGLNRSYNSMMSGIHKNFTVTQNKKYGLISSEGKVLIPAQYDYIEYKDSAYKPNLTDGQRDRRDSVYLATIGKVTTVFNRLGKKINTIESDIDYSEEVSVKMTSDFDSPYNLEISLEDPKFQSGNILFKQGEGNQLRFGVRSGGNTLIPAEYENIYEDRNHCYIVKKDKKFGLLDSLNHILLSIDYDRIGEFNGVYLVGKNEKLAIFSKKLEPLSDYEYGYTYYGNHQLLILDKEGKYGLVNFEAKALTPFIYDRIELITNCNNYEETPLVRVTQGKYQGLLNHEGQELTKIEYDQILPECTVETEGYSLSTPMNMYANSVNQFYFFQKNHQYGIMDTNFHITTEGIYDGMIKSMLDTIVYISKYNENHRLTWGLLHVNSHREITKPEFDSAPKYQRGGYFTHHEYHSGGFFLVKKNDKYGLVNEKGKEIIPIKEPKEFYANLIYNGLLKIECYSPERIYYVDYLGHCTEE